MTPTRSPSQSQGSLCYSHPDSQVLLSASLPHPVQLGPGSFPLVSSCKSCHLHHFHSISSLCACPRLPRRGPLRKRQIVFLLASARPTVMAALLRRTDCWVHMALPLEPNDSVSPGCLGTSGSKWWKEMMSHRTGFLSAT